MSLIVYLNCMYSCGVSVSCYSLSTVTNFHPLSGYPLFSVYILLSSSSVLHSLIVFCPLSNFVWFCHCIHVLLSSSCVAFSVISQGSVIFWRHCGWWVGQKHVRLSSMETQWMMIRGYVWFTSPPPFNKLIQSVLWSVNRIVEAIPL